MTFPRRFFFAAANCLIVGNSAHAGFHLMQIEQIIGGVNGDATAQAIQLRMRSGGQSFVSSARLVAVDASGANPVLIKDLTSNVANSVTGSHVLITTPSFAAYTSTTLVGDFTMSAIPASYLAAGQLRFTDDSGSIYWSVSWGGAAFTGSTTGLTTNDADGNFGPPVATALPSTSLKSLLFSGAATALSTANLANYAQTAGAAAFTNNAGTNFTVALADFDGDGHVDGHDFLAWQRGGSPQPLSNGDLQLWKKQIGVAAAVAAIRGVPEPISTYTLLSGGTLLALFSRRRTSALSQLNFGMSRWALAHGSSGKNRGLAPCG